jgi:hypothetical protein
MKKKTFFFSLPIDLKRVIFFKKQLGSTSTREILLLLLFLVVLGFELMGSSLLGSHSSA